MNFTALFMRVSDCMTTMTMMRTIVYPRALARGFSRSPSDKMQKAKPFRIWLFVYQTDPFLFTIITNGYY